MKRLIVGLATTLLVVGSWSGRCGLGYRTGRFARPLPVETLAGATGQTAVLPRSGPVLHTGKEARRRIGLCGTRPTGRPKPRHEQSRCQPNDFKAVSSGIPFALGPPSRTRAEDVSSRRAGPRNPMFQHIPEAEGGARGPGTGGATGGGGSCPSINALT